jgi:hypothetical protein
MVPTISVVLVVGIGMLNRDSRASLQYADIHSGMPLSSRHWCRVFILRIVSVRL